jgi:hypothetical protein
MTTVTPSPYQFHHSLKFTRTPTLACLALRPSRCFMALEKSLHVNADWMPRTPRRGEEREAAVEEIERADVEDLFAFASASEDAREAGEGYERVFVVSMI